jgi:D-aminoacyl-tRNA deacylase
VHVTGNFGPAPFGGTPGTLTDAATGMMHAIMNRLIFEAPSGYMVSYEATHHGPSQVPVSSCFVEVGSTENEWNDRNAASAVARAVIGARSGNVIHLAGFGGTHYARRQTEITLTTRGAFGHIMPSRDLVHLNEEVFSQIVNHSGAEAIYVDKKSVSREELIRIEGYASGLNLLIVGQTDLTGLGDLPFNEYKKIRKYAERIIPGSVIHLHNMKRGSVLTSVSITHDLIEEVIKINPDTFFLKLDELPVVHLSGGGIACHSTFITYSNNLCDVVYRIVHVCITMLSDHFRERIKISESIAAFIQRKTDNCFPEGILEITEMRFDPVKARNLGVKPGKDFGRLARGETLTIEGHPIAPGLVMKEYIRIIRISEPDFSSPEED